MLVSEQTYKLGRGSNSSPPLYGVKGLWRYAGSVQTASRMWNEADSLIQHMHCGKKLAGAHVSLI